MLFGMLFFDILFAPVEGAFETRYQSEPLDLRSDAFFIGWQPFYFDFHFFYWCRVADVRGPTNKVRHNLIWERLAQIRDGDTAALLLRVDQQERQKGTWCVGVRWDAFSTEEIQDIASVCDSP